MRGAVDAPDHGAQLDLHNKKGMTAVQLAVREGHLQVTQPCTLKICFFPGLF